MSCGCCSAIGSRFNTYKQKKRDWPDPLHRVRNTPGLVAVSYVLQMSGCAYPVCLVVNKPSQDPGAKNVAIYPA